MKHRPSTDSTVGPDEGLRVTSDESRQCSKTSSQYDRTWTKINGPGLLPLARHTKIKRKLIVITGDENRSEKEFLVAMDSDS